MRARKVSSAQIDLLIEQYGPEIQKLINAARRTLGAAFPGATETPDPTARIISYSYGPGYKRMVGTLILSKTGVRIGIPYGTQLPDPSKLLAGKGKVHRHVAITQAEQLKAPALKELLRESLRALQARQ